jgi:hypothetical protein
VCANSSGAFSALLGLGGECGSWVLRGDGIFLGVKRRRGGRCFGIVGFEVRRMF